MKIYTDINEAKKALLVRRSWEDLQLSEAAQKAIAGIFGRPMTASEVVQHILSEVREKGDEAVRDFTRKIDRIEPGNLTVGKREMHEAYRHLTKSLRQSLELAAERIRAFHLLQKAHSSKSFLVDGLGQKVTPLTRIGIYVPGGTAAYPSTVLMTAIPARVAGVKEIVVATPPGKDGKIPAIVLTAAYLAGVDIIYKAGGAQAIAAMAFGTQSIPKVDKICGPGNIFVVLAKRLVFGYVGIDGLAGPTETVILADDTASPAVCAADLLAQAEHDVMASAIFVTTSRQMANAVNKEVEKQLVRLERSQIASASLDQRGGIVVVNNLQDGIDMINTFSPEHVSLMVESPARWMNKIQNAGCIFVGEASAEAFGDYVAGPSHVLPTGGSARFSSALGINEFLKITGVVKLSKTSAHKLAPPTVELAVAEGLTAHAEAAKARTGRRKKKE